MEELMWYYIGAMHLTWGIYAMRRGARANPGDGWFPNVITLLANVVIAPIAMLISAVIMKSND